MRFVPKIRVCPRAGLSGLRKTLKDVFRGRLGFAALPLVAALMYGCATTQDIQGTQNDVSSLRIELSSQRREIAQLKERVAELTKDLNALTAIRESQSNLLTQSFDFSKELQTLKGRFEENKYGTDKMLRDMQAERELLQARIARLESDTKDLRNRVGPAPEKKPDGDSPQQKQEGPGPVDKKPPEDAAKTDPQRLYDEAHAAFKEKKYVDARQKFDRFTKEFPKHSLLPNAYFWLGESFAGEKKHEDAILAYEVVIKRYPDHDKARAAMLKQAYAFLEIGDKKTAKVILERLIEKYPQSTEAELAEKKIAELLSKNKQAQDKGKTKTAPQQQKKK